MIGCSACSRLSHRMRVCDNSDYIVWNIWFLQTKAGGKFGCRIIFPHPKKAELDEFAYLPDELLADNEEDAKQRGSLAGLNHIAGVHPLPVGLSLPGWQSQPEPVDRILLCFVPIVRSLLRRTPSLGAGPS